MTIKDKLEKDLEQLDNECEKLREELWEFNGNMKDLRNFYEGHRRYIHDMSCSFFQACDDSTMLEVLFTLQNNTSVPVFINDNGIKKKG